MDQYFTPIEAAKRCFGALPKYRNATVADFAIGEGTLIEALPFTPANVVGVDIDPKIVRQTRQKDRNWNLRCDDFLFPKMGTKKWLNQWLGAIDVIVLNPPFSCRGGHRVTVTYKDKLLDCRPSVAFVVESLKYLKPKGTFIAILPLSVIKGEADTSIFTLLQADWNIVYGNQIDRNTFKGCNPASIFVTITRRKRTPSAEPVKASTRIIGRAQIIRGCVAMHTTKLTGNYPVIHTTNLNGRANDCIMRYTDTPKRHIKTEFISVPRVGKPDKNKVRAIKPEGAIVLSDCVYGIRALDTSNSTLKRVILDNWSALMPLYWSTCAPYISTTHLINFLRNFGIECSVVDSFPPTKASKNEFRCGLKRAG